MDAGVYVYLFARDLKVILRFIPKQPSIHNPSLNFDNGYFNNKHGAALEKKSRSKVEIYKTFITQWEGDVEETCNGYAFVS